MSRSPARPRLTRQTPFEAVGEFHAAFGVTTRARPTLDVEPAELLLRQDLLDEEVGELRDAVAATDVVGVADALADIVYIACGTAHALGIPFDDVFAEVHRANMSKLGADGRPVLRADGKVLKGPGYRPPDVAGVLSRAAGAVGLHGTGDLDGRGLEDQGGPRDTPTPMPPRR